MSFNYKEGYIKNVHPWTYVIYKRSKVDVNSKEMNWKAQRLKKVCS